MSSRRDNNSFSPYKHNEEVEMVVDRAYLRFVEDRMNDGLANKMWITNPYEFQQLVDTYLETKKNLLTKDY